MGRSRLKELKNELEKLGLARSRGPRVACKYLVKLVNDKRYWAWITVDSLSRWGRGGYRVVLYVECPDEATALKVAEMATRALNELMGEGYA